MALKNINAEKISGDLNINSVTATTISATTYLGLPIDLYITGGTYSNGTTIFTNNTGGTFNVNGYYTGDTTQFVHLSGDTMTGGLFSPSVTGNSFNFSTGVTISNEVGRLKWNDTDGTLDLGLKGSVILQIGQEQVARVVNKTNVDLLQSSYEVVRITGATGQRLSVSLAQANSSQNSNSTLGVVTETILNNQEGFVTTFGKINEVNTTGSIQSEVWNDGDTLYLSPTIAGGLTNVKPVAPNHSIIVGFVEYAHAIHGKLFIKVDNGYMLGDLHDVRLSGLTNNDVLSYDSNNGIWVNRTLFDRYVTGATYSNGTTTFTNNTGGTFNVSGFYTGFTGGVVSGLTATTISATTYLGLPIDVHVTGGTYSNGIATFTNNTGGTFNVNGFYTGATAYFTSGSSGAFSVKIINDTGVNATGAYALAVGNNTTASGSASFSEGRDTIASRDSSHAEGFRTTADGSASHSEGRNTFAVGNYTHTEGEFTTAVGSGSHAGGFNSVTVGNYSFVHGYSLGVTGANSAAIGGSGFTGTSDNTLYAPKLHLRELTGTSVSALGIDANGFVVSGATSGGGGGTVYSATTVFVGNANGAGVANGALGTIYLGGTPVTMPVPTGQYGNAANAFFPGYPMPPGSASTLTVITRSSQPATQSTTIYISNHNQSAKNATVTIAAGSAAGIFVDDGTIQTFALNERLFVIVSNPFVSGGATSAQITTISFKYTLS